MVKKLNWKDRTWDSYNSTVAQAWASRAVGGKYRIKRRESTDIFHRPTGSVWFETERLVNTGPGAWNNNLVRTNPVARTVEQAKAAAEADNARRKEEMNKPAPETVEVKVEVTQEDIDEAVRLDLTGAEILARAVERALRKRELN